MASITYYTHCNKCGQDTRHRNGQCVSCQSLNKEPGPLSETYKKPEPKTTPTKAQQFESPGPTRIPFSKRDKAYPPSHIVTYHCDRCGSDFYWIEELRQHKIMVHRVRPEMFHKK